MVLLFSGFHFQDWLCAFWLTILIEMPVFVLMGQKYAGKTKSAMTGILASSITHPLLWFGWRPLFDSYIPWAVTGETMVILVEAFVFYRVVRKIPFSKALAISLIANATSYVIGIVIYSTGIF